MIRYPQVNGRLRQRMRRGEPNRVGWEKRVPVRKIRSGVRQKDMKQEERPYHHGDLRRTIVRAALEILSETQSVEFSLRELARRAGVSHNAPYKHFADKRELLAAVSTAGFELLTQRMSNEIAKDSNA